MKYIREPEKRIRSRGYSTQNITTGAAWSSSCKGMRCFCVFDEHLQVYGTLIWLNESRRSEVPS